MTAPFQMVEKAIKQAIETAYPTAAGKTGGDLSFALGQDLYVWIGLVPGGRTDQTSGEWIVDIDVFGPSYAVAMGHSLNIEAALVGRNHITSTMRLDSCYQNEGPAERPWDDESSFRIGATYVFTARRSG